MKSDSRKVLLAALANLRAAYQIHQDGHWQVRGEGYYGKHLLLQRLYEEVQELADQLAERAVGMGIDLDEPEQARRIATVVQEVIDANETCWLKRSLMATDVAVAGHREAYTILKRLNALTLGTDDLLMAQSNTLESHQYLLQQALKPTRGLKAKLLK